jgi:putative protease
VKIPELLSPAGDLEKLKVAVLYGADAVYLGGFDHGLRQGAGMNRVDILEGVQFAHANGVKAYFTLNGLVHESDLAAVEALIIFLEKIKIDAVIVSDVGVLSLVRQNSSRPVHLSTQASCLNSHAAGFYKKRGVSRIILGREVSLIEAARIRKEAGIEVEAFIHGAMCVNVSGRCRLSTFLHGRDANRGGCVNPCRFAYKTADQENFPLNAKDLCGLRKVPEAISLGIDALKIEGRPRSHHYVAVTTKVYADALANINSDEDQWKNWQRELERVTHRGYSEGFLGSSRPDDAIERVRPYSAKKEFPSVGVVVEILPGDFFIVHTKAAFSAGEALEILPFTGAPIPVDSSRLCNSLGEKLSEARPNQLVKIPWIPGISSWQILRRPL